MKKIQTRKYGEPGLGKSYAPKDFHKFKSTPDQKVNELEENSRKQDGQINFLFGLAIGNLIGLIILLVVTIYF